MQMDKRRHRYNKVDRLENVIAMKLDASYFFERGMRFLRKNDLERAVKAFQKTVEYEPDNPVNYCNLAGVLAELGDFQASSDLLHYVLEHMDPKMAECWFYLANNYANLGDYDAAEEHLLRYLELDPDGEYAAEAEEMLGILIDEFGGGRALERKQREEARAETMQAIQDGRYFLENGQFEVAVEWLEQVVASDPSHIAARNNLSLAYYYTGQYDKALAMANSVLERQPDNLHALCNRALLLQHFGNEEERDRAVEPLLKVIPLHPEVAMKVAITLGFVGRHAEALAAFRRTARFVPPDHPMLLHGLAAAHANLGNLEAAECLWRQLARFEDCARLADYHLERVRQARAAGQRAVSISYQLDIPVEMQLAEVRDRLQNSSPDEWRRDPLLRASLHWSLRHGNREVRQRVIRALAVVADEDAEEALKAFLARSDIDASLQEQTLVALKRMGAKGTARMWRAAGPVEVRLEDVRQDIVLDLQPQWREVWDLVHQWLVAHGLSSLAGQARRLWLAYLYDELFLDVRKRIVKPETWASGVLYVVLRYADVPVVQRDLAAQFNVSPSSLSKCSSRLEQIVLRAGWRGHPAREE
ncbi:Tetratricopeptide repeat-containing protein [Alicyclobacillus vulcanalis]|uniref:Tetratricopeptide repeat-containing protein n=1 Tax=Alicyclobacillus vulcanalis TaxID=252246 RepID=A0A1N7NW96_9BACL|nr:Tetratricopeptide repeat-containing protein [Alicyclobacillus vulcanalis]